MSCSRCSCRGRSCCSVLLLHLLQLLMLPSLLVLQLLMQQPLMLLAVSTDTVPQLVMMQPLMLHVSTDSQLAGMHPLS